MSSSSPLTMILSKTRLSWRLLKEEIVLINLNHSLPLHSSNLWRRNASSSQLKISPHTKTSIYNYICKKQSLLRKEPQNKDKRIERDTILLHKKKYLSFILPVHSWHTLQYMTITTNDSKILSPNEWWISWLSRQQTCLCHHLLNKKRKILNTKHSSDANARHDHRIQVVPVVLLLHSIASSSLSKKTFVHKTDKDFVLQDLSLVLQSIPLPAYFCLNYWCPKNTWYFLTIHSLNHLSMDDEADKFVGIVVVSLEFDSR